MYIRPEQLLEQYDIEVISVSKGRNCFLCETNLGMKALKEYRGSRERAEFLARMLAFLKSEKLCTEQILATKEGEIWAEDDEEHRYVLFDALRGAECDTKNRGDMMCAAELLAGLHNATEKFNEETPEFVQPGTGELLNLYEKHNRQLRQVRGYIRERKRKSRFEELFLQQYERFYDKAEAVAKRLDGMEGADGLTGFCHGDYNQHNVVFSGEGPAIVNFLNYSYDVRVGDLATFIRKMMEKNNWNTELGMDLIRGYDRVRKMKPQEISYLCVYLAYPEKFWKIANHYSQSHKAWLAERNVEKLERVIAQEDARERFLQFLFHFSEK